MKKRIDSKVEFGFFLSDASFNYLSKTSVGVIINLETGKKKEFFFEKIRNPLEAEKKTMYKAIQFAATERYQAPVFVCDNKFAVQQVKKEFFQSELLKGKFIYAQFLWLPREFLHVVDFFTKNLNLALLEKEEKAFADAIERKTKDLAKEYNICFDSLQKKNLTKVKSQTIDNTIKQKEHEILQLIKEFIFLSNKNKHINNNELIQKIDNWNSVSIQTKVSFLERLKDKYPLLNLLIVELLAILTL